MIYNLMDWKMSSKIYKNKQKLIQFKEWFKLLKMLKI